MWMDNDAERRHNSSGRRFVSVDQKRKIFFSKKNVSKIKRIVTLGILLTNILLATCLDQLPEEDFPPVTIRLHSEEKLKEFEPLRITDEFVTSSGQKWDVFHYFLLFTEDTLYKGDVEGVTVLVPEQTEEAVVAFWQYGWLVIKRYKKKNIQRGLDIFFECGMHTALPERGTAGETEDGMPLGLEETTLLSILEGLNYDVPPYGRTDGKITIDIDWKPVTCTLDKGIEVMEDWLEGEGVTGAPRTLRLEPLKNFSNKANYFFLIDPNTTIIDIRSTLTPEGTEYGCVPGQLRSISERTDLTEEGKWLEFQYVLETRKAAPGEKAAALASSETASLIYFLTGLALDNDTFWVNLNPLDPETIIESTLGSTMVGKIMLEADFRMKKDFCRYTNPCKSEMGEKYWELLDKKREELVTECTKKHPTELLSVDNVFFSVAIRHWIVPDEITAKEGGGGLYIVDATLDIQSEYEAQYCGIEIVNQSKSLSRSCSECLDKAKREYGQYASKLEDELIRPLVVKDLNGGDQYADLQQVYYSLALAQWYKSCECDLSLFRGLIDFEEVETLSSWIEWDSEDIWEKYVTSFQEGEEECYCEVTQEEEGYTVTEEYTGGGIRFIDLFSPIVIVGFFDPSSLGNVSSASLIKKKDAMIQIGNKIDWLLEKKEQEDEIWIINHDRYGILSFIAPFESNRQKENRNEYGNIGILVCVISVVVATGLAMKTEEFLVESVYSDPEQHLEPVKTREAETWQSQTNGR
jgi:hypothetical protein